MNWSESRRSVSLTLRRPFVLWERAHPRSHRLGAKHGRRSGRMRVSGAI